MFDSDEIAFNGATIAATAGTTNSPANPGLDMGPDPVPMVWECIVKDLAGTTPVLTWKVQDSDDGSTWTDACETKASIPGAGSFQDFVTIHSNKRYRRGVYITTGSGLSGTITMGPAPTGQYNRY